MTKRSCDLDQWRERSEQLIHQGGRKFKQFYNINTNKNNNLEYNTSVALKLSYYFSPSYSSTFSFS